MDGKFFKKSKTKRRTKRGPVKTVKVAVFRITPKVISGFFRFFHVARTCPEEKVTEFYERSRYDHIQNFQRSHFKLFAMTDLSHCVIFQNRIE